MECIKLLQSSGADFHKKDKCGRYVNRELCFKCLNKRSGEQSIWKSCYVEMVNSEASWGDSILRRKPLLHQQSRHKAQGKNLLSLLLFRSASCFSDASNIYITVSMWRITYFICAYIFVSVKYVISHMDIV